MHGYLDNRAPKTIINAATLSRWKTVNLVIHPTARGDPWRIRLPNWLRFFEDGSLLPGNWSVKKLVTALDDGIDIYGVAQILRKHIAVRNRFLVRAGVPEATLRALRRIAAEDPLTPDEAMTMKDLANLLRSMVQSSDPPVRLIPGELHALRTEMEKRTTTALASEDLFTAIKAVNALIKNQENGDDASEPAAPGVLAASDGSSRVSRPPVAEVSLEVAASVTARAVPASAVTPSNEELNQEDAVEQILGTIDSVLDADSAQPRTGSTNAASRESPAAALVTPDTSELDPIDRILLTIDSLLDTLEVSPDKTSEASLPTATAPAKDARAEAKSVRRKVASTP